MHSLPKREKVPLQTRLPKADLLAIHLLGKMLAYDPSTRISASQALSYEYLAPYHDPPDEPWAAAVFDWSFDDPDLAIETWSDKVYSEILGMSK